MPTSIPAPAIYAKKPGKRAQISDELQPPREWEDDGPRPQMVALVGLSGTIGLALPREDRQPARRFAIAAKNAILFVEFARQTEEAGATPGEAAVSAAHTRLRPILMTSLAFVFGVAPLAVASGAGSEMRQSLGTAVFAGMLGVTAFGLLFTPAFYAVVRKIGRRKTRTEAEAVAQAANVIADHDGQAGGARVRAAP